MGRLRKTRLTMSVKEKPILFSTPMVQAIMDGRKTQTRRIVKDCTARILTLKGDVATGESGRERKCPYGKVGDVLWVRETVCNAGTKEKPYYLYKANGCEPRDTSKKWKPSIHMPKEAARIWLEITYIRVQRLKDISEEDAIAEGIEKHETFGYSCYKCLKEGHILPDICNDGFYENPKDSFLSLWQSINGIDSWNKNPWVWVVEFKRIEKNLAY